jgi:tetratricopeptide (TPR) repeat protein
VVCCLIPAVTNAAQDEVVRRAHSLVAGGKAADAYALLEPLTANRAGDPDFDYALGLAALDVGQAGVAVLAFERVLAARPGDAQARAEIARAYFELGETATARREFESVRGAGVPAAVIATIDKYLDAIDKRLKGGTVIRAYAETTVGHDSNVNNATGNAQIAIPAFAGALFTMNAAGLGQPDRFVSLGAGASVSTPLAAGLRLLAGVSGMARHNINLNVFDTGSHDANVGLAYEADAKNLYSVSFQWQQFDLDYRRFRTATGFSGQWQHNLSEVQQFSLFGQYSELRYAGQDIRNADRIVGGASYIQAFEGPWSPVAYVTGYIGREDEVAWNVPFLGHSLAGMRIGGTVKVRDDLGINVSVGHELRTFGGQEPLFLTARRDRQRDYRIAADYNLRRDLVISPFIAVTDGASNIPINDYQRTVAGVTLRMDFAK